MLHWRWLCWDLYLWLCCNGSQYSQIIFELVRIQCWMPHHLGFQVTDISSSKYHRGGVHRIIQHPLWCHTCYAAHGRDYQEWFSHPMYWPLCLLWGIWRQLMCFDHIPNTSMYVTITFVNTYTARKLIFSPLQPNFKLLTLPPRHYLRIFLFDTDKRLLVTNPKRLLRVSVTILCNHAPLKRPFSTICLSSIHIQADCYFRIWCHITGPCPWIPQSWYQIFVPCLCKICVAHYFMCNLPT